MFITIFIPLILLVLDLFLSDAPLSVYRFTGYRAEPGSFNLFWFVRGRTRPLRAAQVNLLERFRDFHSADFHHTVD